MLVHTLGTRHMQNLCVVHFSVGAVRTRLFYTVYCLHAAPPATHHVPMTPHMEIGRVHHCVSSTPESQTRFTNAEKYGEINWHDEDDTTTQIASAVGCCILHCLLISLGENAAKRKRSVAAAGTSCVCALGVPNARTTITEDAQSNPPGEGAPQQTQIRPGM